MNRFFSILLLSLLATSCEQRDDRFDYIPLEEYKFVKADIREGAVIQLLSYSGGPSCSPEETYYYQFIGIIKETLDTVRILSPCQIVENVSDSIQAVFSHGDREDLINKTLKKFGEKPIFEGERIVVINKLHRDFEERNFKTAIGTLGFD